jgi:hypothetical protein
MVHNVQQQKNEILLLATICDQFIFHFYMYLYNIVILRDTVCTFNCMTVGLFYYYYCVALLFNLLNLSFYFAAVAASFSTC